MSFRRRALFLAGLFVAVSCSDAGNPLDPRGPEQPGAGDGPENIVQALSCTVDEVNRTFSCTPVDPETGGALGAINVGGGTTGKAYAEFIKTNDQSTADSAIYDMAIKNNMTGQVIGTTDGTTPHAYGQRVFFYQNASTPQPRVISKINPADTAWVRVVTPDTQVFSGAGSARRPYFKYNPEIILPGATGTPKTWKFDLENVATWTFVAYISTEVRYPKGWLNIVPDTPTIQKDSSLTLTAQSRNAFGILPTFESWTWSTSDPSTVSIDTLSVPDSMVVITGVADGTAWIKAVSNHPNAAERAARRDSVLVTVNTAPIVAPDTIFAPARVAVRLSPARMRKGMTVGDSVVASQTLAPPNGVASVGADRGLTYVSKGAFTGLDSVMVDVTDGRWTIKRKVYIQVQPSNYWFVRQGGTGEGGNTRPLGSINAAVAAADGNDSIFVLRNGSTQLVEAATLGAGQSLIGEGVSSALLLSRTGLNEPSGVDTIFKGAGIPTLLMNSGSAPTITVASNNRIEGVRIASSAAAGIHGVGFGTLTVDSVRVEADGPALSLNNGTLAGTFRSLSSVGSDSSGMSLAAVNGSLTADSAGISGAATTAFAVSGGSVSINFPGDVTHSGSGRAFDAVSHTGPATFQGAWTVTGGTGMQFNGASGNYHFFGAVSLNGGDAGLDVVSSTGEIAFDNATVVSPTGGAAVSVTGGTPALVYRGAITHHNGRAVFVDGISADSVVLRAAINSGTAGAPTGQGILVQNVSGGRVVLDSIKSLFTGTNPAVTLTGNTGGTVRFGGSLSITTTTGAGFTASGSDTVTVTGVNSVSTTTGVPVTVSGVHTGQGGVSFSSVSTSAGAANGIVLSSLASGAGFQATGGTISGTTGPAVQLTSMGGVDSTSIRGMTLSRSSGAGAVISGTNFGKLHVLTTSVTASAGPSALALATGTLSGGFSTLSSNSSTSNGVSLTTVAGTLNASGGSINTAGAAAVLLSGGSVGGTVSATLAQASAQPTLSVTNGHSGAITFAGNVTATNGNGLQFDNADGNYGFSGTVSLNGGDAGIDITNGSIGTFTFPTTSNITSPGTGNLVSILNSAPVNFTYSGTFTKANNNVTGILISGNTGGSITFNGTGTKSISSGTAAAVNLSSNTNATITFSGGSLVLASASGAGFTATGGGTVNITGANNTVSSTGGGTAVNVQNTTIGDGGISFYSVTATGGGTNGIVLQNTGSGGFQVAGDGASDTGNNTRGRTTAKLGGGTVALNSGGTISGKSGDAVSLSTTGPVILRNMLIQSNSGDGVQATSSSGVTIDNTRITGHTDNSGVFFTSVSAPVLIHSEVENNAFGAGAPGADIHNVRLISNTGTGSIQSSVIANTSAGAERQLQIFSTTGTLSISVTNNRISGSTVGDGVGVYAFGSSNITANFQNDSIHNNSAFGIDSGTETTQSSTLNITVNNSKFRNNFVGVTVAHGSSGSNTFNVTNNDFQNHGSVSVNINRLGAVGFTSFGLFSGTVSGNTIGTAGVANSGSPLGSNTIDVKTNGNGGTTQVAIVNNTIREIGNDGIRVIGRDANTGHTLHARIQNNNIANFHASALTGIRGELGAASGDKVTMCLNISGNTVTNAPQNGVRVRSVTGGTPPPQIALTMPAYDGTGATYLANQNPAATGLTANTSFSNTNAGSTTTAGNCTTP